jgi:hypothetical protein
MTAQRPLPPDFELDEPEDVELLTDWELKFLA